MATPLRLLPKQPQAPGLQPPVRSSHLARRPCLLHSMGPGLQLQLGHPCATHLRLRKGVLAQRLGMSGQSQTASACVPLRQRPGLLGMLGSQLPGLRLLLSQ